MHTITILKNHKIYSLLFSLLFTLFLSGCNTESKQRDNQTTQPVQITYKPDTDSWWLHFTSNEAILCAINFSEANSMHFTNIQAMEMSAPVDNHDIQLQVSLEKRYRVRITTFNTQNSVTTSDEFHFTATQDSDKNLIEEEQILFIPITEFSSNEVLIWQNEPNITELDDSAATFSFDTTLATLSSTAYGKTANFGSSIRMSSAEPSLNHRMDLLALTPNTTYHHNTIVVDQQGEIYPPFIGSFKTLENDEESQPKQNNVALLSLGASIHAVSSNWNNGGNSSAFGANNTIDGDPSSEWSSNGDGNDAFIEIDLGQIYSISSIGFWTRKMTDSAKISQFEVFDVDDNSLGIFTLPDAKQRYIFDIPTGNHQFLRFEAVSSNGGNTGAKSIEIYSQ